MKIKIIRECSEFLKESNGNPLIKYLPKQGSDIRKVKIRKQKTNSFFDNLFNNVFIDHPNLRQRCIFCRGEGYHDFDDSDNPDYEAFYIFPIDGYRFIYSLNVINSSVQYKETWDKFINIMDKDDAIETFTEVLKYDYTSSNLIDGIKSGCEIILYGIPYYYAIRMNTVKNYSTLFSL